MRTRIPIPLPSTNRKRATGLPPGTLVFTGEQKTDVVHTHLMRYSLEEFSEEDAQDTIPEFDSGEQQERVRWLDVRGLHREGLIETIGRTHQIHSLVLEDILDIRQRPKFDEYERGFFLQLRAFHFDPTTKNVSTEQVSIYVTPGMVFSFQEDTTDLFASVRTRIRTGRGKVRHRGADYLAYALADSLVDNYFITLDHIEDMVDRLEDQIMMDPDKNLKGEIHRLRLQMLTMRKSVAPLREAINRFAKTDNELVQANTFPFLRDLYDHTIQVMDTIDTYRDMINGLYDLYLSEISFRMNNVMQVLTIISTIFIPLTFLAGIYGMNFDVIPELHWEHGYHTLLAVMAVIAALLVLYFKKKNWF